jgi:hypothetical protein
VIRDRDALFLEPSRQFNATDLGHRASVDGETQLDQFGSRRNLTAEPSDFAEFVLSCESQELLSRLVIAEDDLDPEFPRQPTDEEALWV